MHPVLFTIGPITLYSYGLMVALGLMVAITLAGRRGHNLNISPAQIQRVVFLLFLGGIVGARVAYVGLNWDSFQEDLWEIFRLDHGGLVFYGGLIGAVAALFILIQRLTLSVGSILDLLTPPLVIGHAIGRLGCFLNGCCYGKPSALPWAVAFPQDGILRHPTQLYEMVALVVIFLILLRLERRGLRPGTLFLAYGFLYGIWRFSIEFLRADNPIVAGGLTTFQWASLALGIGCGTLLWIRRRRISGSTSI